MYTIKITNSELAASVNLPYGVKLDVHNYCHVNVISVRIHNAISGVVKHCEIAKQLKKELVQFLKPENGYTDSPYAVYVDENISIQEEKHDCFIRWNFHYTKTIETDSQEEAILAILRK